MSFTIKDSIQSNSQTSKESSFGRYQLVKNTIERAQLEDKSIFNPEEAIVFYDLSRRMFKKLLEGEEELPFVAFFKTRKIIIRDEFEEYMEDHPEIMEELRNGKERVS